MKAFRHLAQFAPLSGSRVTGKVSSSDTKGATIN
jgi:hypothetical protein